MINYQLYLLIVTIGLFTYLFRVSFFLIEPRLKENNVLQKGMNAVPISMLVALVIPFTLLVDGEIVIFRIEVLAIFLTIMLLLLSKKYSLGLLFAYIVYFLLNVLN